MVGIGDVARDRDYAGEADDRTLERVRSPRVDGKPPTALDKARGSASPRPRTMRR